MTDYIPKNPFVNTEEGRIGLGNPSKGRQRFLNAIVLISVPDWSNGLSNYKNIIRVQFGCGAMLGFAELIYQLLRYSRAQNVRHKGILTARLKTSRRQGLNLSHFAWDSKDGTAS